MEYRLQDTWSIQTHDNQGGALVKSIIRRKDLKVGESAIGVLHQAHFDLKLMPIGVRDIEETAKCLFFCEAYFEKEMRVKPGQEKPLSEDTPVIMTYLEEVPKWLWSGSGYFGITSGYFSITGVVLHAYDDRLEIECTPHTRFIACYGLIEPSSDHELLQQYEQPNEPVEDIAEVPEEVQEASIGLRLKNDLYSNTTGTCLSGTYFFHKKRPLTEINLQAKFL